MTVASSCRNSFTVCSWVAVDEPIVREEPRLAGLGALFTGNLFNRAIGFLRLLILAPLLGPAGFGALRLAVTVASIVSSLSGLGLHTSYLRFLPELRSAAAARRFAMRILFLSIAVGVGATLVLFVYLEPLARFVYSSDEQLFLTFLIILSVPILIVYKSLMGMARGLRQFTTSALGEALQTSGALVLALLGFVLFGTTSTVAFGAFVLGAFLAVGLASSRLRHCWGGQSLAAGQDTIGTNRVLKYSIWYALIPLFQSLFDFLDRWALTRFYDLELTGIYSLAPIFAGGMIIFCTALVPVVSRQGAAYFAEKQADRAESLIWSAVVLTAIASLVYGLLLRFVSPLIWMVAGETWSDGSVILPFFISYYQVFGLYWVIGSLASLREATWVHLVALTIGTALNITLNLLLVPPYGMIGAAGATLLSMLATVGVHLVYLSIVGVNVPGRFYLALGSCFLVLLPLPLFLLLTGLFLIVILATKWFLKEQDRELVAEFWKARFSRVQ